jgi:hypothetical protein
MKFSRRGKSLRRPYSSKGSSGKRSMELVVKKDLHLLPQHQLLSKGFHRHLRKPLPRKWLCSTLKHFFFVRYVESSQLDHRLSEWNGITKFDRPRGA